jgi:4-amino-4-deoxychorismate lyase
VDTWLVDGQFAETIPITDRGFVYGDGIFETIAFRRGKPRFLELHLERLAEGCARLAIRMPAEQRLRAELRMAAADHAHGTAKLIVTRGSGPRGYAPPTAPEPRRVVAFFPSDAATSAGPAAVRICRTVLSINPALAGLKTLGRLDHVLARAEWRDPDIAEGLMRDPAGRVVCGTMSNVFAVRHGRLVTPELSGCGIRGVMRRVVIGQARQLGMEVSETQLSLQDIRQAEELFLTNALIGIWPVASCDGQPYALGPFTTALREALVAIGVDECRP